MNKDEVLSLIKKNKIEKKKAVILISDFLVKSKKEAEEIYKKEFES